MKNYKNFDNFEKLTRLAQTNTLLGHGLSSEGFDLRKIVEFIVS